MARILNRDSKKAQDVISVSTSCVGGFHVLLKIEKYDGETLEAKLSAEDSQMLGALLSAKDGKGTINMDHTEKERRDNLGH